MYRRTFILGIAAVVGVALNSAAVPLADKEAPVRVLFVLNGHDYKPKAPILEKVLKEVPGFQVQTLEDMKKLADVKRSENDVLLFYGGPQANELQERAIEKFVEEGGGVVALHHASANSSKAWIRLIGGQFTGHIAGTHKLNVVFADDKRPITRGVEPFTIEDEEYKHRFADVERHVLARFRERPKGSDPKANNDIMWTREVGKGRVGKGGRDESQQGDGNMLRRQRQPSILAPGEEPATGPRVSPARVRIADVGGEEVDVAPGGGVAGVGDQRRHEMEIGVDRGREGGRFEGRGELVVMGCHDAYSSRNIIHDKDVIMREIRPKRGRGVWHRLSNIVLLSGEPL